MNIIYYSTANTAPLLDQLPADLTSGLQFFHCKSREELKYRGSDAEAIITSARLDEEILAACPRLRWIQVLSAGVDRMPLEEIGRRGIRLTNARGVHLIQMSEFAMLMMLQWARRSDLHFLNQVDKVWGRRVPSSELYGQTVGILGSGTIGQAIAAKASAFGMKTLGFNRSGRYVAGFDQVLGGDEGLQKVLAQSDYLIVLLPATEKTRHFLGMKEFRSMKPSACLINMARGSVLNEPELVEALRNGIIAGAALDVFEIEPLPPESPLWELPNVIITPHVAGASPHYTERVAAIVSENLSRFRSGAQEAFVNEVDCSRGY